jgi:hypothetical protein
MVINIPFGSVHQFLKIESENRTKPRQILIGSVRFWIRTIKNGFFRFGLVCIVGLIGFFCSAYTLSRNLVQP